MTRLAKQILSQQTHRPTRLVYGKMASATTVQLEGQSTAIAVPQLDDAGPLEVFDFVAVLIAGADALIIGKVDAPAWTDLTASTPTMATNWSLTDFDAWRKGDVVQWRLVANRTTSALTVGAGSGDITNTNVATLHSDLRGSLNLGLSTLGAGPAGRLSGGAWNPSTGVLQVTAVAGDGTNINVSDSLTYGGTFYVG